MEDAVEELEDHNNPQLMEDNVANNVEDEGVACNNNHPNNNFCFTQEDFLETQYQMNDATRHHGSYNEAWDTIKALEGKVIETSNAKMGKMQWTVVASESIVQDNFSFIEQDELRRHKEKMVPLKSNEDILNFSGSIDFSPRFWLLWPNSQ